MDMSGSASCSTRFTLKKIASCIHWMGGWVGLRADVDAGTKEENQENPCLWRESNLDRPARHNTGWAIPAPNNANKCYYTDSTPLSYVIVLHWNRFKGIYKSHLSGTDHHRSESLESICMVFWEAIFPNGFPVKVWYLCSVIVEPSQSDLFSWNNWTVYGMKTSIILPWNFLCFCLVSFFRSSMLFGITWLWCVVNSHCMNVTVPLLRSFQDRQRNVKVIESLYWFNGILATWFCDRCFLWFKQYPVNSTHYSELQYI